MSRAGPLVDAVTGDAPQPEAVVEGRRLSGADDEPALDLDEATERLDRMSTRVNEALAILEQYPSAGLEPGAHCESSALDLSDDGDADDDDDYDGADADASSRALSWDDAEQLNSRTTRVADALKNELSIAEELRSLHLQMERENAQRSDDCEQALAELEELRKVFELLQAPPGASGAEAEPAGAADGGPRSLAASDP
ncbi:hypothetical protein M885DRAFT_512809 [Pelagophyceae sp. CCMP2097]|nr:hypothetical protein M885DRAFT_512809 [Pelagophyceae sp. CCMP2097]